MKNNTLAITTVLTILLLLSPTPSHAAMTLTFQNSDAKPIPKYINGVNQNWFRAPRIQNAGVKYLLQDVNFNPIRFPGGTESNYYNWELFAPDFSEAKDAPLIAIGKRFPIQVAFLSPIESAKIANSFGKDLSIVVNTMRNTPGVIKKGLIRLKNAGVDIKFIEMGNEGYFYPGVQNPTAYFKQSKIIAEHAKSIYPNVKIGMVISNLYWRSSNNDDAVGSVKWVIPTADWFDAVIVHAYINSYDELLKDNKVQEFESIFPFEIRKKLDILTQTIAKDYPGKKIWITEWNTMEKQDNKYLNGAYANSFHAYNMLLTMLQYPSITLANYHSMMGSTFGMISARETSRFYGPNPLFIKDEETFDALFTKNIQYWPLKWMGDAITSNANFIIASNTTSPTATVGAVYYYTNDYTSQSLSLINRTNTTQNVNISSLVKLMGKQIHIERLSAPWNTTSTAQSPIVPTKTTMTASAIISLSPYEIMYISLDKSQAESTTIKLKSDINGDKTVDKKDYDLLISRYGNPYSIFDFNFLITDLNK